MRSVLSNSCDPLDCSLPGSSVYGIFPGKNTGVGCHSLLQGLFPIQGLNPGLLHWQVGSLASEPPGKSPKYTKTFVNFESFMIKTLSKLEIKGTIPNLI